MSTAARNPSIAELTTAALGAPARCGRTPVVLIDGPAGFERWDWHASAREASSTKP